MQSPLLCRKFHMCRPRHCQQPVPITLQEICLTSSAARLPRVRVVDKRASPGRRQVPNHQRQWQGKRPYCRTPTASPSVPLPYCRRGNDLPQLIRQQIGQQGRVAEAFAGVINRFCGCSRPRCHLAASRCHTMGRIIVAKWTLAAKRLYSPRWCDIPECRDDCDGSLG